MGEPRPLVPRAVTLPFESWREHLTPFDSQWSCAMPECPALRVKGSPYCTAHQYDRVTTHQPLLKEGESTAPAHVGVEDIRSRDGGDS